MKPIKIMHVVYSLGIGGLENGVVNLINAMDRERFAHALCCVSRSGPSAEKLTRKDVEIFEIKKNDEARDLFLPWKLARVFKQLSIDVVHTRNWGAIDGVIGARLARIPVVIHGEHGRDMTDPEGTNKKRNLMRKALSYFFVDRYTAVSKKLGDWLISEVGISEKKVQIICNGVDTVKFNSDDKDFVRAKYHYTPEQLIIGTVGRLDPVKDQQLLIKAFAQLATRHKNLTLFIIGDGPCRENLERLIQDLELQKNVYLWGARRDVPELLKLFDVFVLPSIAEGISNTILEAMATGLPVIATRVGGNPELVVDGKTGYLVPKEDVNALATALERYILDRSILRKQGAASRERAIQELSLDRMVARYEVLYTDLVTRS
jgi:sugar transferase (PEP-CTERM/EpsH1 system associated)